MDETIERERSLENLYCFGDKDGIYITKATPSATLTLTLADAKKLRDYLNKVIGHSSDITA
jgi:hypothetical protein